MNVVSCYRAAQIAQVSKQCIGNQKKANQADKKKYKYFGFDKINGDFGIDLDHNDWKRYMVKRRSTPGFDLKIEKQSSNSTDGQSNINESQQSVSVKNMIKLTDIIAESILEIVELDKDELSDFLTTIEKKYEDPKWKQNDLNFVKEN